MAYLESPPNSMNFKKKLSQLLKSFMSYSIFKIVSSTNHPGLCDSAYPPCSTDWQVFYHSPYHPASKDTLARWVKDMLHFSGIDTSHYAAHSCRSASSPKVCGVNGTNSEVWPVEKLPYLCTLLR